jgi:opacity protein-like surface antigen
LHRYFAGGLEVKRLFLGSFAIVGLLLDAPLSIAQAADMAVKAPPMAEPAFTWTGGYLGINGGWAQDSTDTTGPNFVQPSAKNGWLGGGHGGVNFQFGTWVVGAEFDADYMRLNASAPCFNAAFTCNTQLQDQYSIRARRGVAACRSAKTGRNRRNAKAAAASRTAQATTWSQVEARIRRSTQTC